MIHPKSAIKSKAKKKIAGTIARSRSNLSRKADLEFLDACDNLVRAEGSKDSDDNAKEAAKKHVDIGQCEKHVDELERKRQSMRVT
jgi:hypothetical protein